MRYRHIDENPAHYDGVEVIGWASLPVYDNDIWNDIETLRQHLENFRVPRDCWPDFSDDFPETVFEAIEKFNETIPEQIGGQEVVVYRSYDEVVVYRSYDEPYGIWFCLYDPAIHTILEEE